MQARSTAEALAAVEMHGDLDIVVRALLTTRQIDVLRRIREGQPNKIIAYEMDLSEKSVKAHVTAIFKTLNVVHRTQAAAAGRDLGLIHSTRVPDMTQKR